MKNAHLVMAKITLDVKNCLCATWELGDSLHVRRNLMSDWYSLIDLVCMHQVVLLQVRIKIIVIVILCV